LPEAVVHKLPYKPTHQKPGTKNKLIASFSYCFNFANVELFALNLKRLLFFYDLFLNRVYHKYVSLIMVLSKFYPTQAISLLATGLADGRLQNLNIFAPNSTGVID